MTVIPYMHYKEHSHAIVPKMKFLVIIIQSLETLERIPGCKKLEDPCIHLGFISVCYSQCKLIPRGVRAWPEQQRRP